jgi:cell division initiation protein
MDERITVDTILDKKFGNVAKGYNPKEVDNFLDEICDEFDRRDAEMNALRKQLSDAQTSSVSSSSASASSPGFNSARIPAVQPMSESSADESFREILEMAKRVKDQTIADAQTKAAQILANAEAEAKKQMGDLLAQKEALTKQVDELKASAKAYYEQSQNALNALGKLL